MTEFANEILENLICFHDPSHIVNSWNILKAAYIIKKSSWEVMQSVFPRVLMDRGPPILGDLDLNGHIKYVYLQTKYLS